MLSGVIVLLVEVRRPTEEARGTQWASAGRHSCRAATGRPTSRTSTGRPLCRAATGRSRAIFRLFRLPHTGSRSEPESAQSLTQLAPRTLTRARSESIPEAPRPSTPTVHPVRTTGRRDASPATSTGGKHGEVE